MPLLSLTGRLTPELCEKHPTTVFLFGDNCMRRGEAGQANIRNFPNAFGIPTKRTPSMHPRAFFDDDTPDDRIALLTACNMALAMSARMDVVVPVNPDDSISLGCGLSELPARAPQLYALICNQLKPEGEFYA